jgi:hypothetical protein
MTIASLVTGEYGYFAGAAIGIFCMGKTLSWETIQWALTFWGVWHLIGEVIAIIVTLPIIEL